MEAVAKRVDFLERIIKDLAYAHMQTEMSIKELSEEMKEFKNEIRNDIKEMNKKWGELANKIGTFAEDIAAPNIPFIGEKYFDRKNPESFTVRSKKKNPASPSETREFDAIAVYEDMVILNETKSKSKIEYIESFIDFCKRDEFFLFFLEYTGKKLIPVYSSLYLSTEEINLLSRNSIYAMALADGTMDLLNYNEFSL